MKRKLKRLILCALALLLILPASAASANSAEPPCLTVIVTAPPEDLELSLALSGKEREVPLSRVSQGWETYYRCWHSDLHIEWNEEWSGTLLVKTGGEAFSCPLSEEKLKGYNSLVTLDLGARTVTPGEKPWRQPLLIALRVGLTLLIEGLIFLLFRYRTRRSWLVFLIVNLVTQSALNIALAGFSSSGPYGFWMFFYMLGEILIFGVEAAAYCGLLREFSKRRAVLYAFTANAASLFLGGYIISFLPV